MADDMKAAPGSIQPPSSDITWAPAWRIAELIAARKLSPVEVLDHFLARIDALDPSLHAFDIVDRDGARAQAAAAERAVMSDETLGALHGVPTALKNHILVKGFPTLEFMATEKLPAMHDDIGTERLRRAGAVIVGYTVMPGMGTYPTGGASAAALAKHARSPWDLSRVPGSSSAGSAAATAAGMLPLTIGSDGGGSTRLPAALSGVVGYHPSVGRIPFVSYRSRLAKNVFTQATIGPMARDVRDVAIAMQAMAGPDGRDFYCKQERAPDYLARLGDGVRGLNLAWTDDFGIGHTYALPVTPRVIATVREAAQGFNTIGAVLTQTEERWEDFYQALKVLNYVTGFGANQSPEAPTAEAMQAAYELRGRNYDGFRRLFERYDLLVSPTVQFTAFTVEDWDAAWTSDFETYPGTFTPTYTADTHIFNWLGFPAISVPVGFVDGLPVGMQIVGPPEREPLILQAAQAFMAAFPRPEHPPIS